MKNRKNGISAIGGASLLTIFAVLCMTVFAMLSLSTAIADSRMMSRMDESAAAYYDACNEAYGIIAMLREGDVPEWLNESGDGSYSFVCEMAYNQALKVTVRNEDGLWTISNWTTGPLE